MERKIFTIKLSDEERNAIEAHPNFVPAAPGRSGGVGAFIRSLVRNECGLDEPEDYHEERSRFWARKRRES